MVVTDAGFKYVDKGYTIAWGGDVSEDGFTRQGLAYAVDTKKTESLAGSDMARWLKLTAEKPLMPRNCTALLSPFSVSRRQRVLR